MTYSDDDLDRLFRAAKPSPRPDEGARLSAAEISVREGIIRGTRAPRPRKAPRRLLWATVSTAAAVVAVLVAVNVLGPAQRAIAVGPPPLHYSSAGSLSEVVEAADEALIEPPDVEQRSGAQSVNWGWSADMHEGRVEAVPQEVTFEWTPGETATTTIVAGDSFWSDDDRPSGLAPSPYAPGELIDQVVTPSEDVILPPAAVDLSGSSPEDLEGALAAFGATADSSSGELLSAIAGLFGYWTLSDAQHATLLQMLVDAGGVTVRGETTDRLDRQVIGLQVSSVIPERVETVFVSTDTGRIVGFESELIEPLDSLPPGVILYSMWDAGVG